MPELPEVETVCRGLAPVMTGATFLRVELRRADLRFSFPHDFRKQLEGRSVISLSRRAKYLLAALDDERILAMHLGMTGRFLIGSSAAEAGLTSPTAGLFLKTGGEKLRDACLIAQNDKLRDACLIAQNDKLRDARLITRGNNCHDHVIFEMSSGALIRYNDARRFGFMTLIDAGGLDTHPLFHRLGIEPLGPQMTAEFLAERAKNRKQSLKAFLLDQHIMAGIGNIYACEVLYRARLSPQKPASILADKDGTPTAAAWRLAEAVPTVLADAIAAGGSSLRDYRQTDGSLGYFQHSFAVYGREGQVCPCQGCGGVIVRMVQNGRSTFYCPQCQK